MTYRRPIRLGLALLLTAPLLAGCSDGWRKTLGLKQSAPDEFKVARREPLAMPASLDQLPEPKPGAQRPQAATPRTQAERALFASARSGDGAPGAGDGGLSDGERRLLSSANAGAAPEDIRQLVEREAEQRAESLRGFLDDYIFWREPERPGEVIDAAAEAKRLRDNRAQGRPLTEGEVPVEEREDRGILGNL